MGTTFTVSAVEGRGLEFYAYEPIETSESEPLADLYNRILLFISQDCGVLLDIAERTLGRSTVLPGLLEEKRKKAGYEVLTNVVWEEVAMRLMAELGHVVFAAGRPSIFHRVSPPALSATVTDRFDRITSSRRRSSHASSVSRLPYLPSFTFAPSPRTKLFSNASSCPYTTNSDSKRSSRLSNGPLKDQTQLQQGSRPSS